MSERVAKVVEYIDTEIRDAFAELEEESKHFGVSFKDIEVKFERIYGEYRGIVFSPFGLFEVAMDKEEWDETRELFERIMKARSDAWDMYC